MSLNPNVEKSLVIWHEMLAAKDVSRLGEITHPEAVFRSPMAHSPYPGAFALALVLSNVVQVFESFTYHRKFYSEDGLSVTLEFSAEVDGKQLKGADFIRFNEEGQITEFEVMVRPMSGLAALGLRMKERVGKELPAMKA